ncbi:MAG: TIGR01777 family oxidoreductase [Melioribacteraceae bacterium]|nr:TIGR01777 family oxidoreductase [Melioribacteraceae bacterium]
MKITITGATGLIGKKLVQKLAAQNHEISVLTRNIEKAKSILPQINSFTEWDYNKQDGGWIDVISQSDVVIHLAGENIMAKRWNKDHKYAIRNSRVEGTKNIVRAIENSDKRPKVFISASAVGYYGNVEFGKVDEEKTAGDDFLARVTDEWETSSKKIDELGIRRVCVRLGLVLDKNEGALAKMLPVFKLGMGGKISKGSQYWSWIHVDDVVSVFLEIINNENLKGAINCTAPNPVTNKKFTKILGAVLGKPALFPVPKKIIKAVLGEGSEAVLSGVCAVPKKLLDNGFKFKFENLEDALKDLLK